MKKTDDWNIVHIVQNAEQIFMDLRWPDGPVCPDCHSHQFTRLKDGRYKCKECGKVYSIKSDSLFHGSKLPISYWMITLYLMLSGKGLSSYEMARKLQVTQKTAYYMMMRIRLVFDQDDTYIESDLVAHDEVYVGGDYVHFSLAKRQRLIERFKLPKIHKTVKEKIAVGHAINARTKKAVFGITDGSTCVLRHIATPVSKWDIISIYNRHVSAGGLAVSDKCTTLYGHWNSLTGRELHTCNHSKKQYVADNGTSSNMIESVFSWLERTNIFVQVHYSVAYCQLYLDEFAYRYNTREMSVKDRIIKALHKCKRTDLRKRLIALKEKTKYFINDKLWFDPVEFFKLYPHRKTYEESGLVYRREEFVL